jgi:hypothetical protein
MKIRCHCLSSLVTLVLLSITCDLNASKNDSNSIALDGLFVTKVIQNVRPINNLYCEYYVEELDKKNIWKTESLHRLYVDLDKDKFIEESLNHNNVDDSIVIYRKNSWDGIKYVSLESFMKNTGTLDFSKKPTGKYSATISPVKPQTINPFSYVFNGLFSKEPLFLVFQKLIDSDENVIVEEKTDKIIRIDIAGPTKYTLNIKDGSIIKKDTYFSEGAKNDPRLRRSVLAENKTNIKGWLLPHLITYTEYNNSGKIQYASKYIVKENSIKINEELSTNLFGIEIPEGSITTDNINKLTYTASGLNPLNTNEEQIEEKLDKLIENATNK